MTDVNRMDKVMYRLPDATECHRLTGKALGLDGIGDLGGKSGFVFAPFHADASSRLVFLDVATHDVMDVPPVAEAKVHDFVEKESRQDYRRAFERMKARLASTSLKKVVLARRDDLRLAEPLNANEVFAKACRMYPHQMVALVSTTLSGTWIMATPEVLIERKNQKWATMALAGTMSTPGPWSEKNMREQRIVADYIHDRLTRSCVSVDQQPPRTVTAARLFHLRTDFEFTLREGVDIVDVLADLFPTPAVCGMPKREAMETILQEEGLDRRYYSGFCGPWNLSSPDVSASSNSASFGQDAAAALYVSLRCMEISYRNLSLYAGGGLLDESEEATEWEETEKKMQTMKALL